MTAKLQFQIEETTKRNRLDNFLSARITTHSKIYLRNRIGAGACRVNGEIAARGLHLRAGDAVEIEIDLDAPTSMKPEAISLEIVFEDNALLVVDKPAEMLVHPSLGQKNGTLLNGLSYHLNRAKIASQTPVEAITSTTSEFVRPFLVHRLDRKTSGLIVVAKTPEAMRALSIRFQKRLVEKTYLAIVEGIVSVDMGTIEAPIGQDLQSKRWTITASGKTAETKFRVLQAFTDKTLLELQPVTGRTNQLRIHCAHIGHPIFGDNRYGDVDSFSRLCLHAARLSFRHPTDNNLLEFESDLPAELKSFLEN
jgi:23S rRNA pseudouridine1911/1915/1917 synthase